MQIWYEHIPIFKKINYYSIETERESNMYTKQIILSIGYKWEFWHDWKNMVELIAGCVYETLYWECNKFLNSIIELPTIDIRTPN